MVVGSARSLAEREMKTANGTIHKQRKKKANTCKVARGEETRDHSR